MAKVEVLDTERVMRDDEPVYGDYSYLADAVVVSCPPGASRVSDVRAATGARVVRLCDMVARGMKPRIRRF